MATHRTGHQATFKLADEISFGRKPAFKDMEVRALKV
jgi:hypothetical protein